MRFLILFTFLYQGLLYNIAAQTVSQAPDSTQIERAIVRADSLSRIGDFGNSIALLKESISNAEALSSDYLLQKINIHLAENYLATDQFSSANEIIQFLLEAYPKSDNEGYIKKLLADFYRSQGDYKKATDLLFEAKALVDSAASPLVYGKINLDLGKTYESTGNFATAFSYHLRSIEIAEITGDSLLLGSALNSIGVAYNDYKKFDQAKLFLERALAINQELNNRLGHLRVLNNLAITYQEMGEYEQAIAFYNDALEIHEEVRENVPPFKILYNLGQTHKIIGELGKAEEFYHQSLEFCKKAGIKPGLVHNYGALANVAELREDYEKAYEYYSLALGVAREIGANQLEQLALFSLGDVEEQRGNYENALSLFKTHKALSDSLEEVSREQEITDVETKLGLRQQEEVNRLLQEKQEQQQARIATQNWLIGVSGLVIAVTLSFMVILYRSNKERDRINKELEAQRNKLKELIMVKDKMLAILSHDLRSPLASVKGMLYLFREGGLSPQERSEQAAELEVTVDQNLSMMDNLLAWARQQMSGMTVNIEPVDASKITEAVLSNHRLQAKKKGIRLINKVSDDLLVQADPNLLQLILRNLVSNSIKFSHAGDEVKIQAREVDSGSIVFEVQDTGIGIPEEKKNALFAMSGESRTGTNNENGSGLGLQLCKEFVEKQNGEIHLESTEGEGTTFVFSIPKAS